MALSDLLNLSSKKSKKTGISEERLNAQIPIFRQYIAYWREYPDMFVEFLCGGDKASEGSLKLYFYQRVFLRAVMRHRYMYATFPRGYSKSFLSILTLLLRCTLYPNSHLFVTTGGKEQAAGILKEKVEDLCKLVPGLKNEINWGRGQTKNSKDNVEIIFKNGSKLDVMAARQSSRGKRAIGGLMEECVLIDQTLLNEVILPTMNIDRRLPNGTYCRGETINKSQVYITTAGWKNSFAYQKLIELTIKSVIEPDEAITMGGTWRVPVLEGLLARSFVSDLKAAGTYNDASFAREFESEWGGDAENAFFSQEQFDKNRVLQQPEWEYSGRSAKNAYYVIGVDVGRKGCTTEAVVIKVTPQVQGAAIKTLVNIYTLQGEHFGVQSIELKKLYYKYKAKILVIDANGIGAGLVDFMTMDQIDPETEEIIPNFGVGGGTYDGWEKDYKKFKTENTEQNAMFLMKANAPINTEAHSYAQTQISSGKVRFLIDENQAKTKLLSTKVGQTMTPEKRAEYLMPFTETTILREQMMNLTEDNEGVNIILKMTNRAIGKDKFSAFEYALYYIKQEEESRKKRRGKKISDFLFFS